MRPERLLRLALGPASSSAWGHLNLAVGVALAIATLVMLFGLARGVEGALRERLLGTLPDRMKVQPASFHVGPMRLVDSLDEPRIARLKALPGVRAVHRQARLSRPVQLRATYGEQSFWSDVVLEGADPGLVEPQLARGRSFDGGGEGPVPAVLPRVMMDVLAAGVSIHTDLPAIAPEMLTGRHFTLLVGQSSFGAAAGPVRQLRCEIVGISDQVGLGGPTIPLDVLQGLSPTPLRCHAATLELDSAQRAPEIEARLREMGLEAPGMNLARQIGAGITWVRAVLAAFGSALLLVAAMSLYAGLSLQVREEESTLGLYRALGASGRDLLALFLVRAGILGMAGSVTGLAFGLLAGAWVGRGIASLSGGGPGAPLQLFQPDPLTTSGFVAFGIGTCLAAGFLPARRASRLPPAEVLRR